MTTIDDCKLCGASPAKGWAFINGDRFCHGELKENHPSCYTSASMYKSNLPALGLSGSIAAQKYIGLLEKWIDLSSEAKESEHPATNNLKEELTIAKENWHNLNDSESTD